MVDAWMQEAAVVPTEVGGGSSSPTDDGVEPNPTTTPAAAPVLNQQPEPAKTHETAAAKWLEQLADASLLSDTKRQRIMPIVDASSLPPDSVRALVAARQAAKIKAFRHAQSIRGEPPLKLPELIDADTFSIDADAIKREEQRIVDDESKFMATLKRIRQEERGIVNLPDKLKEVLKSQRAALTSKFSVSNVPPPLPPKLGVDCDPNLDTAPGRATGSMPTCLPVSPEAVGDADVVDERLQADTRSCDDEDAAPDVALPVRAAACNIHVL